jgi:hypothetical protein
MTLPKYIIERVNGLWELYQTDTCFIWSFDTRTEAEDKLKLLIWNP